MTNSAKPSTNFTEEPSPLLRLLTYGIPLLLVLLAVLFFTGSDGFLKREPLLPLTAGGSLVLLWFSRKNTLALKLLTVISLIAITFVFLTRSNPSKYPVDLWWWDGVIAEINVSRDGDQDIISTDHHRLVLTSDLQLKSGDKFHLLHAKSESGRERTFFCATRLRTSCISLSLAINPPRDTVTWNQGKIQASTFQN